MLLFLAPGVAAGVVWVLIIRAWNSENWGGLFLFPLLFIAISTGGYLVGGRTLGWEAARVVPWTLASTVAWSLLWGVIGILDSDTGGPGHLVGMLLLLSPATCVNIWRSGRRSLGSEPDDKDSVAT